MFAFIKSLFEKDQGLTIFSEDIWNVIFEDSKQSSNWVVKFNNGLTYYHFRKTNRHSYTLITVYGNVFLDLGEKLYKRSAKVVLSHDRYSILYKNLMDMNAATCKEDAKNRDLLDNKLLHKFFPFLSENRKK
jgi:hypothetical protein